MTGQSGVIESIGYPTLPYTDNLLCEWRLQGPSGHYLSIHFENLNLQNSSGCEKDFVEIWENHTSGEWNMSAVLGAVHFHTCSFSLRSVRTSQKGETVSVLCKEAQIGQLWESPASPSLGSQSPRCHSIALPGESTVLGRHPLPAENFHAIRSYLRGIL